MLSNNSIKFIFIGLLLTGCSQESENAYTEINETGFMQACTKTAADVQLESSSEIAIDTPLQTKICKCTWEQTENDLTITEFNNLDSDLITNPENKLPKQIQQIIADCVISEGSL